MGEPPNSSWSARLNHDRASFRGVGKVGRHNRDVEDFWWVPQEPTWRNARTPLARHVWWWQTSPALLLGIVMLLLFPRRLAADGYPWAFTFFAIDAENWAVVPGLALLFGALPFLRQGTSQAYDTAGAKGFFAQP